MTTTDLPTGDNRPSAYMEEGVAIYRASSLNLCEEALVALRMGIEPTLPPEWLQKRFDEGTMSENHIVSKTVEHYGGELVDTQSQALIHITDHVAIRGSTDGVMEVNGKQFGIEAKKLGPGLFSSWKKGLDRFFEENPGYAWQLTAYMEATQLPFVYAVGEWNDDIGGIAGVYPIEVHAPPADLSVIKNKILRVEARARAGDLRGCDGKTSYPCPVYFLHDQPEKVQAAKEDVARLHELGDEYLQAHEREKEAKDAKKRIRNELLEVLEEGGHVTQDGDEIEVDPPAPVMGIQITPYIHTSSRLDRKALEEATGVNLDDFKNETRSVGLRVTAQEE